MKIVLSLTKREAQAVMKGRLAAVWNDGRRDRLCDGPRSVALRAAELKIKTAIARAEASRDGNLECLLQRPRS